MNDLGNIADNFGIQSNIVINSAQMKWKKLGENEEKKNDFFEMNKKIESEEYGENSYSNHIVDFLAYKIHSSERNPDNENLENNLNIYISKLDDDTISRKIKKKLFLAVNIVIIFYL